MEFPPPNPMQGAMSSSFRSCEASADLGGIALLESMGFVIVRTPWWLHPRNFTLESEKKSLEKEAPLGNHHFQVPC